MKKILFILAILSVPLFAQTSFAHMLWVNAFKTKTHLPDHVLTSIGYVFGLPLDELLLSGNDVIEIDKYVVADPKGKRAALPLPKQVYRKPAIWEYTKLASRTTRPKARTRSALSPKNSTAPFTRTKQASRNSLRRSSRFPSTVTLVFPPFDRSATGRAPYRSNKTTVRSEAPCFSGPPGCLHNDIRSRNFSGAR